MECTVHKCNARGNASKIIKFMHPTQNVVLIKTVNTGEHVRRWALTQYFKPILHNCVPLLYCMVTSRRGHGFHVHTDAENVLCACYCCTGNCFADNYGGRQRLGDRKAKVEGDSEQSSIVFISPHRCITLHYRTRTRICDTSVL